MDVKKYARSEVSAHDKVEDCWFVYKNKVYDVTKFVPLHPAGPSYFKDYAGQDTSIEFD